MENQMIFCVGLPLAILASGAWAISHILRGGNTRERVAQDQVQALQRSVQEKNAEIELLYQAIRKRAFEEEAFRKRIEFLQRSLERRSYSRNLLKAQ